MKIALIDLRSISGYMPLTDRFYLGLEIVKIFSNKYKVAVLAAKSKITKITENLTAGLGAHYFASHDIREIKKWFKPE